MKLVTIRIAWYELTPEYVPGKCNIGSRGRAIRLTTGLAFIGLSIILGLIVLSRINGLFRLVLVLPSYIGLIAVLEGSMSFCVLHATRGTYDVHEPYGFASKRSATLTEVASDQWKKLDRSKALKMHIEALTGAVLLAVLLALA